VVRAAQRGDLQAFNRLIQAHETLLYTVAYRLLGEAGAACEVTQAALAEAYRRPAQGELTVEVWLLRQLVTACRARRGLDTGPRPAPEDAEAGLQRALSVLPLDLRLAVVLVDVAGLDAGKAAAVLETTRASVQANLTAARVRVLGELRTAGSRH
jgi:RNA polymerase sigma-70 factor (ECF subfamily)